MRLTALCGAFILTIAAAGPALGDGPFVVYDEDEHFEYLASWLDCGFPVMYGVDQHVRIREWRDGDGLPTNGDVKSAGTTYYYAVGYPDDIVSGKFSIMGHVPEIEVITPTLYEWYDKMTGSFYNVHLPGIGNVDKMAGNLQVTKRGFVIIEWHKWAGTSTLVPEAICAALDPEAREAK